MCTHTFQNTLQKAKKLRLVDIQPEKTPTGGGFLPNFQSDLDTGKYWKWVILYKLSPVLYTWLSIIILKPVCYTAVRKQSNKLKYTFNP